MNMKINKNNKFILSCSEEGSKWIVSLIDLHCYCNIYFIKISYNYLLCFFFKYRLCKFCNLSCSNVLQIKSIKKIKIKVF